MELLQKRIMVACIMLAFAIAGVNAEYIYQTTATDDAAPYQYDGRGLGTASYIQLNSGSVNTYNNGAVGGGYMYCGLFQWDLPANYAGDSITAASVSFYLVGTDYYSGVSAGTTYVFYRTTAEFSEGTVTWATKPAIDTTQSVTWTASANATSGQLLTLDVAELLRANGDSTIFGLAVIETTPAKSNMFAFTKNNTGWPTSGKASPMSVTYVPEPATLVIYGMFAAFGGIIKKRHAERQL